ncbi:putative disease resistance RPP13-like protein 3 [Carex rostrata]
MAEAVVDFVWQKLGDALTGAIKDALLQEGLSLYSVNDKGEAVQRELERIKSFLRDADSKSSDGGPGEERVRNWVKEVRNVAYSIEDAVDTFQAKVDWINYKEQGFINWIKRCFKKPMLLPALHTLGSEMDDAQARIKEITESRLALGVISLDNAGKSGRPKPPIRQLIYPELGKMESKVVGFESDKDTIIARLLDEHNLRRSVISIVGPGGIGKTTLAQTVFNNADVQKRFEVLIWLLVSEEYNPIELLKKMLQELQLANQRDHHKLNEDNLISEIHESMKEKKYLVVMDDIWTDKVWDELHLAFPDVQNGSRVLITSRFVNIAKEADPNPHELQYLNEEQSLKLLLRKAFPMSDPNETYPQELLELAREFARKCSGLPLQLVVLGGLLSKKNRDYSTWHRFMETMDWVTDGKRCFDIIATSYKHLPLHLKSCFMSFAVFPEDYEIDARSLISYWSIEGFIPKDGRGTLDGKAQDYLEDLVQRCMIQVTAKTSTGTIEKCRVHTLLWNVAVYEAKEKNFITIFWKQEDYQKKEIIARHASFQFNSTPEAKMQSNSTENNDDVIEYTGPNVRSLMFFGKILPIHSRMKLLKVLIAYRTKVTFYYGKRHTWLEKLISLRHLEFRECELENDTLPEKINRLHNLQYLDLTDTKIVDLPKSIKCNEALILVVNRVESKS